MIYSFCFFVFALFYLPFFLLKGKHKGGLASRFGFVPDEVRKSLEGRQVYWVHAVSVGEVVQAFRLVAALKKRFPQALFVVTTTTLTGREIALKLKSEEDTVLYFPVDFSFSVRRFISAIHPSALILIETEIWPNLLAELSRKNIPAFIVNGRISDKAISKYRKVRFFLAPFLNRLKAIGAQDDLMKQRFIDLGADPRIVSVTGNMKFDWQPNFSNAALVRSVEDRLKGSESFLWVAGSTHEGEEEILLDAHRSLSVKHPHLRLLIAPRHLNRIDSILRLASKKNVTVWRTSELRDLANRPSGSAEPSFFLLDSMGVLADIYPLADVVFVGGSLVPSGGHNLVEPAFFEKPVLFGPFMNNFSQMAQEFKKVSAGIEVKNAAELEQNISELIENRGKGAFFGRNAKELVLRHQGATERNVGIFLKEI